MAEQQTTPTPTDQAATAEEQRRVLESIFSTASSDAFDDNDDAWVEAGDTPQQQEGLPAQEALPPASKPDNDAVRFEYWQSEAQKAQAEIAKTKAEADYYKRLAELQEPQAPAEPTDEKFPDPPTAPKPPAGYNYEEALSNPQSPSAQYVNEYQTWQNNMFEYNNLKTQYLEAVMQEKFEALDKEKADFEQRKQQEQAYNQQIMSVKDEVMTKYGADEAHALDFIQKMSSPESLTVENLYKLYQAAYMNTGKPVNQPSVPFAQAKVASGFPPPFSQLPTGSPDTGRSVVDQVFDGILATEKKRDW